MTDAIAEPPTGELATLDSWDVICQAGREAQTNMDEARWIIGDLACLVSAEYGRDKIADFAREVNVEKARVKEYRTVARFYKNLPRQKFAQDHPNLTYSHMRDAMRFGDQDRAMEHLEACAIQTLTVEAARIRIQEALGKPVPPKKLEDWEGNFDQAVRWLADMKFKHGWSKRIHIVIYEE